MRLTDDQLRGLQISSRRGTALGVFNRLVGWGWFDLAGRSLTWFAHQRSNHNAQFEEPRERKPRKKGGR